MKTPPKLVLDCILVLALQHAGYAISGEILNLPQPIWDSLQADQKVAFSERFVINLVAGNSYGNIIDIQTLNESTQGTNEGSRLGAAYGSAAYVDNSFRGGPQNWNYSATGHLTAQIAGALIGSMADRPSEARFRTRYTIKNGNGGVEYVDEIKPDAFRHSMGLCVALGPIRPIDQETCTLSRDQLLAKYAWVPRVNQQVVLKPITAAPDLGSPVSMPTLPPPTPLQPQPAPEMVLCKFGVASPVRIKSGICEGAGGAVIP